MAGLSVVTRLAGLLGVLSLMAAPVSAIPIASCTGFVCVIPENVLMQFPVSFGFAISGDVVVTEANGVTVSDLFRIFNDVVNTGGGTGLGTTFFLYSSDDSTPLPSPSTYSSNVTFIKEGPGGTTIYSANGDTFILNTPEPATFGMLGIGLAIALGIATKVARNATSNA
jgi:hypothetical protein